MKREYKKPNVQWVPIVLGQAVADICWGYAKNGKTFYYNVPGRGYAILNLTTTGGCDGGIVFNINYSEPDLTPEEIASLDAEMEKVIAEARASAGNSGEPFKGSPFSAKTDPSWS